MGGEEEEEWERKRKKCGRGRGRRVGEEGEDVEGNEARVQHC